MKRGFKVIDSELHLMEPLERWEKHLAEPYRSRTRIMRPTEPGGGLRVEYGDGVAADANTSEIRGLMKRHSVRRLNEEPRLAEAARNCTPDVWLRAMDVEGIDVAVLMPTMMLLLVMVDGMDPKHAMAMCRVYNDYAHEFTTAAPE